MAKRKIIWSHQAEVKLYKTLEFYIKRNNSTTYSTKINKKIRNGLKLLVKYPNLGLKTDMENISDLIIDQFIVFYEVTDTEIIVHTIWDSSGDPNSLMIK